MKTRDEILDFLVANNDLLRRRFHLTKIGLFGSFARNEQNPDSDVDLLVEIDAPDTDIHQLKKQLRVFLSGQFGRNVDLARERYLKPYAREHILKETAFV